MKVKRNRAGAVHHRKGGMLRLGRRLHVLEALEHRQLLAGDTWTNPVNHLDVNSDGHVTALDALGVVDDINLHGSRRLRILASDANSGTQLQALSLDGSSSGGSNNEGGGSGSYVDVNGDGSITPADALAIMDHLNLVATQVQVRMLVTDLDDCPITQVRAGQQFKLHALVKDVRDATASAFGVFAAYVDVTFDSTRATFSSPFTYGADYQNQKAGTIESGLLNDVGAFTGDQDGLGKGDIELFSVIGTATATLGTINFAANYGDDSGHETLVFGNLQGQVPVPEADIQYLGATLEVVNTPLLNISCTATTNEGNGGGTTNQVFTITLPGGVTAPVTFVAQTFDGSAVAGQDYIAKTQTLTFNPGDANRRFTVQVVGDDIIENDETFQVKLSNPTGGAGFQVDTATSTIVDNDTGLISIEAASSPEGNPGDAKNVTFTLTLSNASSTPVTVQFATQNDTATAGTDYTATNGTATFAPGATTVAVNVPIIPNTTVTTNRAFRLVLSNPVPSAKVDFDNSQATGTILEDDTVAAVNVSINDVTIAENAAAGNAVFTVSLSASPTAQVTVAFATSNGTATAGSDYTAQSGTLTFAAGVTTQTISVPITNDNVVEPSETFTVTLSNPTGATLGVKATGTGTITNDDSATLTINDVAINESGGNAVFTVTMASATTSSATVVFATSNGTATAGQDYTAQSGTLNFAAGETTKQVTIAITEDSLVEANETFSVTLSNPTGATLGVKTTGVGTINDNDVAKFSINDAAVIEGNSGSANLTFTVTLSNASTGQTTVVVTSSDDTATAGADYTAKTETLTFAAGETTKNFVVAVLGDTTFEPNETLQATLSNPTGGAQLNSKIIGVGTITNDDGPKVSVANVSVAEGDSGTADLVFTVSLDASPVVAGTVQYAISPGTAATPADYGAGDPLSGTLTFAVGEQTKSVTVKVVGDALFESDETLTLTLSQLSNLAPGASLTATGTITNDDAAPHASIDNVAQPEGASGADADFVFTVALTAAAGKETVVIYNTVDGTASAPTDYAAITPAAALTIAAGQTTGKITVKVKGDATLEADETFTVRLQSVDGATDRIDNGGLGNGTIQNDDAPPTLSIGNASVVEGSGDAGAQSDLVFTVTLSAAAGVPVTVGYHSEDGAGDSPAQTVDNDYVAQAGTVTFAAGETSKTITIKANHDKTVENNETLRLVLESPTNATIAAGAGVGTIVNDDGFTVSADTPSKNEGQSGETDFVFTVALSAAQTDELKVVYATIDGTATSPSDFSSNTGTLTFAPGATSQKVTVKVKGDAASEANETFKLRISAENAADAATILTSEATATILDDDLAQVTIDDAAILEGNTGMANMVFTLHLSHAVDADVVIPYFTQDFSGGGANSGSQPRDYEPIGAGSEAGRLTITAGLTTATITIKVNGDSTYENDERFRLLLTGQGVTPQGKVAIEDSEAFGTIQNDDAAPVFTINNISQAETNSGETDFAFTVTLTGQTELPARVVFTANDGTAVSPNDYVASQGTLTFNPPQSSAVLTIKVKGDVLLESNETFKVALSNAIGATISTTAGEGLGTILDDEPKPNLVISDITAPLVEGTGADRDAVFTVTLSSDSPGRTDNVTVVFSTITDTAVGGQDFTSQTGTLTFAPGDTTKQITVKVTADTADEPDEQFFVDLSSATIATITKARGSVTIQDDDAPPAISIAALSQAEGTNATTDTNFVFNVTLNSASGRPVTVVYATADGTSSTTNANALAGRDYTAQSGTLTFAAGETTKQITIKVKADNLIEQDQAFTVNLTSPANATLAAASAIGTIQNDDNAGNGGVSAGSLAGRVYIDTNNDGVQNNGEQALSGVMIKMKQGTSEETVLTNANGDFAFSEAPSGSYTLEQVQPASYLNGQKSAGANGNKVTSSGDNAFAVTLEAGDTLSGITFGERGLRPEFISKRLFLASNTSAANLQALNLTAGAAWFSFDAGWDGVLTAEALGAEGQAKPELTLYDVNLKPVAASNRNDPNPRLDFVGTPGQAYFLRVGGNNNDVDVKVTNVIHQAGDTVTIRGTNADDVFGFQAGASSIVTVNGTKYTFDPAKVRSIIFEGMGGSDSMSLVGSTGNDTATVAPGSATMTGGNYAVSVHDVADIAISGGGGDNDQATVNDSSGDDQLVGAGSSLSLSSDLGLAISIEDFDRIGAHSSHGGNDASNVDAVDYIFSQSGPWN